MGRTGNARMKLGLFLPALGVLLCVGGTTAQNSMEIDVVISYTTVILTCNIDRSDPITWKKDNTNLQGPVSRDNQLEISNYQGSKDDGTYTCAAGTDTSIPLYLKAKVCENCNELDVLIVAFIIIADLLITFGVLILVYYCSKSQKGRAGAGAGAGAGGRPRGQKMQRPPPIPNPDYEPIRKGQREVYAGLESRGF
ncbi:T-cell surface glycoprotein CD3 epsilon chain [Alligator mississippiensis]|uniref:T-cell surface glycoprotein CD3 epsilon chain n=1 Tax=Alligator mississippiensis TaxID=8496 RepID=UPI002877CE33|nr:T-cell surface glycoprotein CD3 epsilon chain [Alligator mississippiensis]XP_019346129.2 T-cell surface glycoprotein CD3 epsilon chain [Alligator mississippiensis]XP_019346133.2 T-cell surface glycoprotein CD3 epsilon chain [Alligator mississippiensis]XP_059575814.1 T-cell surface glycoprotein CD3 epsilon chain [Alligator mississippiensis]XP_059575815.1 T-cell surface glycoprotein CD3 epsilon chain [Alligator mississippiensis]